jgi:hypothetical protein
MGRRRSDTLPSRLLDEARSIEALLDDLEPSPEQMEAYWDLSLRMVALITEVEAFAEQGASRAIAADDAGYVSLRKRLVSVENVLFDLMRT